MERMVQILQMTTIIPFHRWLVIQEGTWINALVNITSHWLGALQSLPRSWASMSCSHTQLMCTSHSTNRLSQATEVQIKQTCNKELIRSQFHLLCCMSSFGQSLQHLCCILQVCRAILSLYTAYLGGGLLYIPRLDIVFPVGKPFIWHTWDIRERTRTRCN